jgi:hypothetical protein
MLSISFALSGYAIRREIEGAETVYGRLTLVAALLQTIGAMLIAAVDIDIDQFSKRHPVCVATFALSWIVYISIQTIPGGILMQVKWPAALPMAYFLLRFQAVRQMSEGYPPFTDLFVYTLALDYAVTGVWNFIRAPTIIGAAEAIEGQPSWAVNVAGIFYFLNGVAVIAIYWHLRSRSRRLAVSAAIYTYLLGGGVCSLEWHLAKQNKKHYNNLDYTYAIIHIAFPLTYFIFRHAINKTLGWHWLQQRKGVNRLAHVLETHGNLAEVEAAITARDDLNAFVFCTEEDEFTLLHLAVWNGHHDAIQRLLHTGTVAADKSSGSKGHTAVFLAAELGRMHALVLLHEHSADLNMLADDDQSPLIVATANGHKNVAAWLRAQGANENHEWMGMRALNIGGERMRTEGEDEDEDEDEDEEPGRQWTQQPLFGGEDLDYYSVSRLSIDSSTPTRTGRSCSAGDLLRNSEGSQCSDGDGDGDGGGSGGDSGSDGNSDGDTTREPESSRNSASSL